MTWIWMLVARVTATCELTVNTRADVLMERAVEDEGTAELAEIISSAAAGLAEYAPDTDRMLLAVTTRDGVKVPVNDLLDAGLLVVDGDGGLGFTVGRGMVAMMLTGDLVTVRHPDPSDYAAAYQLPGFKYWRA